MGSRHQRITLFLGHPFAPRRLIYPRTNPGSYSDGQHSMGTMGKWKHRLLAVVIVRECCLARSMKCITCEWQSIVSHRPRWYLIATYDFWRRFMMRRCTTLIVATAEYPNQHRTFDFLVDTCPIITCPWN